MERSQAGKKKKKKGHYLINLRALVVWRWVDTRHDTTHSLNLDNISLGPRVSQMNSARMENELYCIVCVMTIADST